MLLGEAAQRLDVETARVVDAAGDVRDRDHGRALGVELGGRDSAHVAETLDDAALLVEAPAELLAGPLDHHHDARSRRLVPEERAPQRDRLAGDDLRHGVADLHRVGVHHPGHRLLVRGHVGSRDVLLRADDRQQLGGEAPRDLLELVARELTGAAADATLGAPVREPQERALPGHPHRQRGALAERHLVVVADAALGRAEHRRVLHPVPREDRPAAGVELDRHADDERALRVAQPLRHELLDVRVRKCLLVLRERRSEERRLPFQMPVLGRDLLHLGHAPQCSAEKRRPNPDAKGATCALTRRCATCTLHERITTGAETEAPSVSTANCIERRSPSSASRAGRD